MPKITTLEQLEQYVENHPVARLCSAVVLELDDARKARTPVWVARERIRSLAGDYKNVVIETDAALNQILYNALREHELYLHVSLNSPTLVAYTRPNTDGGPRDIQVQTKLGKLLREFTDLSDNEINAIANAFTQQQLTKGQKVELTTHPDEIMDIYRTLNVTSCMSYAATKWKLRHNYFLPSTDVEVQERIDAFRAARGRKRVLHPVMWYALAPDLALAYYSASNKLQARAIVNTKHRVYTRVYGNSHLGDMLKSAGYSYSQSLGVCKSAILVATTSLSSKNLALLPYVDTCDPYATINVKAGVMYVGRPEHEAPPNFSIGQARNYTLGGNEVGNYRTAEDMQAATCSLCKGFLPAKRYAFHLPQGTACRECACNEIRDKRLYPVMSLLPDDPVPMIVFAPKEAIATVSSLAVKRLSSDTVISTSECYTLIYPYRVRIETAEIDDFLNNLDRTCTHAVHRSVLPELVTDVATGFNIFRSEAVVAIAPDESVGYTITPTRSVYSQWLQDTYGTTRVLTNASADYPPHLQIATYSNRFYLKDDIVLANDRTKAQVRVPWTLSSVVFDMHTQQWWYIPSLLQYVVNPRKNSNGSTTVDRIDVPSSHSLAHLFQPESQQIA